MNADTRLPRLARLVLRLLPIGERRADCESDLAELFDARKQSHGLVYAAARLCVDLASLAVPRLSVDGIGQDLRFALRLSRKHAAIVGVAVVGLGLAIAMCTTVFTVVNAVALRPFDMDDPSSVVSLRRTSQQSESSSWAYSQFLALQQRSTHAQIEASLFDGVRVESVAGDAAPPPDPILFVSGGYLQMLGGRALIGRTLQPADDRAGAAPVVVLNHAYWTAHYGGDRTIVGRPIRLSAGTATIVGVLRPRFTGPMDRPPAFWAPFASYSAIYRTAPFNPSSTTQIEVIARVFPDARAASTAELSGIAAGLPTSTAAISNVPDQPITGVADRPITSVQLDNASSRISGPDATDVFVVIALTLLVVGLVLALACANVANLLLAGATTRAREFGLRVALGASRQRLLRQLLVEGLVISVTAGVIGLIVSLWMVPVLASATDVPTTYDLHPDFPVLMFTTAIALVAGIAASLAPARHGARGDVVAALKSSGTQSGAAPRASKLQRAFVGFQVAASTLLLVTAALFLKSATHLTRSDPGFDVNHLATFSVSFPQSRLDGTASDAASSVFWRSALDRVRQLPSVEGASLVMYPPFGGALEMEIVKRADVDYTIYDNRSDAGYFSTAGFRVVRGRAYTADEVTTHAPVAVISETLATDFFRDQEPIGASLSIINSSRGNGVTIIGVVKDAQVWRATHDGNATIYRPIDHNALAAARLVVRATRPGAVIRQVEDALTGADPSTRIIAGLVSDDAGKFMRAPTLLAGLSGIIAALALVLSVLGIFGVTSFVVSGRKQEVSVRMAIGASSSAVIRLLLWQNMRPVGVGLVVGLLLSLLGNRLLVAVLSGVSAHDATAILPAMAILLATAAAAIAIPAIAAARADPASVLKG